MTKTPRPNLATDADFAALLISSYNRLTGRSLINAAAGEQATAAWLYHHAAFVLLAHDGAADPVFTYANAAAQARFGYDWGEFIQLPSRLSAEAPDRAERQRLLDAVASKGFIDDYQGIRVAKSGRRFWIENAVVWELTDDHGVRHGQAATFRTWRDL